MGICNEINLAYLKLEKDWHKLNKWGDGTPQLLLVSVGLCVCAKFRKETTFWAAFQPIK